MKNLKTSNNTNESKPTKGQTVKKLISKLGSLLLICLLIGLGIAAYAIKEEFIGRIDLTGGHGGPQPAINFFITMIIFFILLAGVIGIPIGFIKIIELFEKEKK